MLVEKGASGGYNRWIWKPRADRALRFNFDRVFIAVRAKTMPENLVEVLSAAAIAERVSSLGAEISASYQGREIALLAILDDSFVFLADLIRAIPRAVSTDFLRFNHSSHGNMQDLSFTTQMEPARKEVLLVCGVVDTGITQEYVIKQLEARGVASIKLCALVDKPTNRHVDLTPDWKVCESRDPYVVGYGLGIGGRWRELPYLATFEAKSESGNTEN
jgi:hypoxanthine phosphoribosyltransferase